MDTDIKEPTDDGLDAIVYFGDGFIVSIAVNASNFGGFGLEEETKNIFTLGAGFFKVSRRIEWDNDKEGFVHNIGFLRNLIDEIDVVVHKNTEQHVVIVTTNFGKTFKVRSDINALRADKDLNGKFE